jgi:hypothetical protein
MQDLERNRIDKPVFWALVQAQYVNPQGLTTWHAAIADATQRYIAVPPVAGTDDNGSGETDPIMKRQQPTYLFAYRPNNTYYLSLNTRIDTKWGAPMEPDVKIGIPLNPSVKTIGFCAAEGTDVISFTWGYGI